MNCRIRKATEKDSALIADFLLRLAKFERLTDDAVTSEETVRRDIFGRKLAHALIVETPEGEPAGIAVYYRVYSTFAAKASIFLEDIYIDPAYRRRGFAREIFAYLERLARTKGCARVQWNVLDWNDGARAFYRSLGARDTRGWTAMCLDIRE